MKKWVCLILTVILCAGLMTAAADGKSSLSDFRNRLKNGSGQLKSSAVEEVPESPAQEVSESPAQEVSESPAQEVLESPTLEVSESPAQENEEKNYGLDVWVNDPLYQKVRSSVYLNKDTYFSTAYVMIELKNISGMTLYPDDATVIAYDDQGGVLAEESLASVGPDVVRDGESVFIRESFFSVDVNKISYFEVKLESDTSSFVYEYADIEGKARLSNGEVYVEFENKTNSAIYNVTATIVMEDRNGRLLDVATEYSFDVGVAPGSVMLMRTDATNNETYEEITDAVISVYANYTLN